LQDQDEAGISQRRRRQIVGTGVLAAVYGGSSFSGELGYRQPVVWLYFAAIVALIWMPRARRTTAIISAATIAATLGVMGLVKLYGMSAAYLTLLFPFPGFLASGSMKPRWAAGLVGLLVVVILLISGGGYGSALGAASAVIGIYLGFLGGRLRREARELDKRRLQEVQIAHEQLQEAHAELTRAHEELRDTTVLAMQSTALAERARIARDIHDGIGHHLTSLVIQLQALQTMLPAAPDAAASYVPDMLTVARQAVADVRVAVRQWSADEVMLGLSALRGLADQVAHRGGLVCTFDSPMQQSSSWSTAVNIALYRILQESLTNVLRHAKASHVTVTVGETTNSVRMVVQDTGGYTGNPPVSFGFGLRHMRERCRELGGEMTLGVDPTQGHGLRVCVHLPLDRGDQDERVGSDSRDDRR